MYYTRRNIAPSCGGHRPCGSKWMVNQKYVGEMVVAIAHHLAGRKRQADRCRHPPLSTRPHWLLPSNLLCNTQSPVRAIGSGPCAGPAPPPPHPPGRQRRGASMMRDKNRRHIGKYQSKRPPARTQRRGTMRAGSTAHSSSQLGALSSAAGTLLQIMSLLARIR